MNPYQSPNYELSEQDKAVIQSNRWLSYLIVLTIGIFAEMILIGPNSKFTSNLQAICYITIIILSIICVMQCIKYINKENGNFYEK